MSHNSNGNSRNAEDLISATTRLSKAVTSTASALMNNNSGSNNILLNSTHYQKAIYDTLISPHKHRQKQESVNFRSKKAPSELLRFSFSKDEISYRALTHISDDLLNEIPQEGSLSDDGSYTLFQGFNASIPQVDEELYIFKELNLDGLKFHNQKLLTVDNDEKNRTLIEKKLNNPLPIDISSKQIKQSKSIKNLKQYKHKILQKMHYLEIKKNLNATEIKEIDGKIEKLLQMRDSVFQKVAKIEKDEIYLENCIQEISSKISTLESGTDMENKPTTNNGSEKKISFEEPEKSNDTSSEDYALIDDSEDETPLMSQSIYTSLQKKPPKFHKISSKNRKIKPTLQTYYSSGTQIASFHAHEQQITCFDFDYPFGTLVSSSLDSTVRVWDLSTQKCMALLEGHDMPVRCMQMDDNLLVTGSEDSNLKLWDLSRIANKEYEIETEQPAVDSEEDINPCIYTFESHIDEITALHFDNVNLISGSSDRTIRQWDMNTGHCLQTLDVLWVTNQAAAAAAATSPLEASIPTYQGSFAHNHTSETPFIGALQCYSAALASGTADGIVRLWDLRSGDVIRSLTGHTGPVTCLQFDDKSLITGSEDQTIKVWDLRMGKIQDNLVYDAPIHSLQFDSQRIVFTNGNRSINVYDRVNQQNAPELAPTEDSYSAIAKYARYKEGYLVGGYLDGIIKTWAV